MWSVFKFCASYFAKFILFSMGWSLPSKEVLHKMNKHKRTVAVFSHTSYADFYIMILYLMACPEHLRYIKTLVKPQPFAYAGYLLRKMGGIPATKVDERNGGAIPRIVKE